jgi:hypothetical protein
MEPITMAVELKRPSDCTSRGGWADGDASEVGVRSGVVTQNDFYPILPGLSLVFFSTAAFLRMLPPASISYPALRISARP